MHEIWTIPENQGYLDGICVLFHALLYLTDISDKFSELKEDIIKKIIYLFLAALGLSCSMRDLLLWRVDSLLRCAGFSLVVARGLCSCGTWA